MGFSLFVVEKQRKLHFWSAWGEIQNPPTTLKLGYLKKAKGLLLACLSVIQPPSPSMRDSSCALKQTQIGMCHSDLRKGGSGEGAPFSHFIMAKQLVPFFPTEEPKSSHCYLLWEIAY